jgi:hypothetical protein
LAIVLANDHLVVKDNRCQRIRVNPDFAYLKRSFPVVIGHCCNQTILTNLMNETLMWNEQAESIPMRIL